jgi:hypothetical protein
MFRLGIVAGVTTVLALAEGFTFNIAGPVASSDFRTKTAAFVFRTEGCADPAHSQIDAAAEGLVNGARRSVPLKVATTARSGVYAIFQSWPAAGAWVVTLKGVCAGATAGGVIPMGPKGFIRESAKWYPRAATRAEVDASLKALVQGGSK